MTHFVATLALSIVAQASPQGLYSPNIAPSAQAQLSPAAQAPGKLAPAAGPAKVMPAAQAPGKLAPAAGPAKVMPAAQAPGKLAPAAGPAKVMPAGQSPFGPAKTLPSAQGALKSIYGGNAGHNHKAAMPSSQNAVLPSAQSSGKTSFFHRLFH